jgi:hypothetical protein
MTYELLDLIFKHFLGLILRPNLQSKFFHQIP